MTNPTIAIDVLLEPDATMVAEAQAMNTRLLALFPKGFALDATHRPHITLIQCFVASASLAALQAAVAEVFAQVDFTRLSLQATTTYHVPGGDVGLAGIVADATPELLELQQAITTAVSPFIVPMGTIEAFTADHGNPALDAALIDYMASFVDHHTGPHFSPHVTTGVAPIAELEAIDAEPFEPFAFAPVAAAVDQLGPFGTAARNLWRHQPPLTPSIRSSIS